MALDDPFTVEGVSMQDMDHGTADEVGTDDGVSEGPAVSGSRAETRRWSEDEKAWIVRESLLPGAVTPDKSSI